MHAALPRVTIRGLGHVALFVRDLDATRRFDRDLASFGETPTSFSLRDPDGHEVERYVTKPR